MSEPVKIIYPFALNTAHCMNGEELLAALPEHAVKLAFFDPQYRGVMDKLSYGNEGARQKGRVALTQMCDQTIVRFIAQLDRVLTPSGHLLLWIDKFHLAEGIKPWLHNTSLQQVDLITWDKGRIGMGYRTRRRCEYLCVLQKLPTKAKGYWHVHNIPDVWCEKVNRQHPHCKPLQLQAALINAVTMPLDVVLDPAAGSFSVMQATQQTGRQFLGCDVRGHDAIAI